MPPYPVVTIFGSSRPQPNDPEYVQAYEVGNRLARTGFTVCNGGYGGIMEASAHGAKDAGGQTIAVIARSFVGRNANSWMDTVITVDTLIERMLKLISLGDAYVVLKGGTGTLLELAAVWEFINKGVSPEKPIVVVGRFWNGVVETLKEELAWEGLSNATRFVKVVQTPEQCASVLSSHFNILNK